MANCTNCDAQLQPAWKFCIRCGTRAPVRSPEVPTAIRPDPAESERPARSRRRLDLPLILGIVLAAAGVALVGYLIVTFDGVG